MCTASPYLEMKWTTPLGILPALDACRLITDCKNSFSLLQRWIPQHHGLRIPQILFLLLINPEEYNQYFYHVPVN